MTVAIKPETVALQRAEAPTPLPLAETAGMAAAAQQKAIVEAQYVVALRNPRDLNAVRLKLLDACKRPAFARAARYSKPVGGRQPAVGPSIRFAEEVVRVMGNIRVDRRITLEDEERRIVTVTATDLENNASYSADVPISKTIERREPKDRTVIRQRVNSTGNLVYVLMATDDELLNKQNAQTAKAARNASIALMPSDFVEEAMEQVEQTLDDEDARDPAAARKRMMDAFHKIGIAPKDVEAWLARPLEQITGAEGKELLGILQALKDGETTWSAVMDSRVETLSAKAPPPRKGTAGLKESLKPKDDVADALAQDQQAARE